MFNRASNARRSANFVSSGANYNRHFRQQSSISTNDVLIDSLNIRSIIYYVCIFIVSIQTFLTLRLFLSNNNFAQNPYDTVHHNRNKNTVATPTANIHAHDQDDDEDDANIDLDDPLAAINAQIEGEGGGGELSNDKVETIGSNTNTNANTNKKAHQNNQFSYGNVHFNPSLTESQNNINFINVSDPLSNVQGCKRYTYMQLTDGSFDYLYGILAIHGALLRIQSKYSHNVMLMANGVPQEQIDLLHYMGIGTYYIDSSSMDPYLTDCIPCWNVTFYKMFIWNMTQFDKVLYLDTDVGIMSGNRINNDGFDGLLENYPTPAAVSDRANQIELNGGILLVEPDSHLFSKLLKYLANVRNPVTLRDKKKIFDVDPWNCEWRDYAGDQGFINSFFRDFGDSNPKTDSMGINGKYGGDDVSKDSEQINGIKYDTGFEFGPFYNIHYRYGILTSRFSNPHQWYFLQHRPYMIKGVHFTVYKPWHRDGKNRLRQILSNMERTHQKDSKNDRVVYTDEMMTRFWVRYWLDVRIALKKCGDYCKKHFPQFEIPGDVDKWLKLRPVPFLENEDVVHFHV